MTNYDFFRQNFQTKVSMTIFFLYTSYNTKSALIRIIGNKPIKDSIRYIVMCGVFYNATKEIMIGKNILNIHTPQFIHNNGLESIQDNHRLPSRDIALFTFNFKSNRLVWY